MSKVLDIREGFTSIKFNDSGSLLYTEEGIVVLEFSSAGVKSMGSRSKLVLANPDEIDDLVAALLMIKGGNINENTNLK